MGFKRTIAAATLLLFGCEQGGHVTVTGSANDLRFLVTDGTGRAGCADSVSVEPVTPDDVAPLWQVTAVNPASCMSTLRYGATTDRFAEQVRAKPLRSGTAYRVRVSGAGFFAVQDFRVLANGIVRME